LLLAACNDDTTTTDDEVGMSESESSESTSESGESTDSESTESTDSDSTDSDSTDTDSTDSTDSESTDSTDSDSTDSDSTDTGDPICNAADVEDIEISFSLIGSQAPAGACENFVFEGQLEGGGGGTWNLDACPCGALCLIPDPYTLTLGLPDLAMQPSMPVCPKIAITRDPESCAIVSVVIEDIVDPGRAIYIASNQLPAPAGETELDVGAETIGLCECVGDCEPPTLERLLFDWLGNPLELVEGESGTLVADDGDWTVYAINSHLYAATLETWYGWVMKR
jgi:hypothetical protein